MNFSIRSFPAGDGFWRVDWIGKVKINPNVDSEPLVAIHLTRLKDDYLDPMQNGSLILSEQRTVHVALGALPLISIGSVWKNKKCHEIPYQNRAETLQVNTEDLTENIFNGYFFEEPNRINPYISSIYYPLGKENFPKVKDAPIFVLPVKGRNPRYKFYLLPQIEIFRFYYLCSSFAAKCIWNDDITMAINQEKCALLIDNDLRIYLKKNLADHESWLLARWFLSPEMRSQIKKMVQRRRIDAVNSPQGINTGVHAHIGFPFEGSTRLTATGKRIRVAQWKDENHIERTEWAFLVTRIQNCSHPLPFRNLIVDRENNSQHGLNKNDQDLEPAWPTEVVPIAEPFYETGEKSDITNVDEPDNKLRRSVLELFHQRFLDLQNKQIIKEPKDVQKYKNVGIILSGQAVVDSVSTADGTNADSDVGPTSVATNPPTNEKLPANLETFIQTLNYLRGKDAITKIETLEIGGAGSKNGGENVFHYSFRMKGKRSWHIISTVPPRTRGAIVARVELQTQIVYLIEIERKSDKRSTQILYSDGKSAINDGTLHRFLLETAARNSWPEKRKFPTIRWVGTNHNEGDTIERYGERILKKILNLENL